MLPKLQRSSRACILDLSKSIQGACMGHGVFAKKLDYILPANFFLVPFAHAFLYGVLNNFWGALLPPKTGEQCTHAAFFLSVAVIAIQLSCQVVFLSGCLHATQINAHAWW